jgi:glucan endo-1,3-alpha-glucosidase
MASYAPTYWGCVQTTLQRRYYESQGGEGTVLQWTSIITNQPDWVEICTWNDFNESTYVSPVNNPGQYSANVQSPNRCSHAGYLELSKYYIDWYKTGQQPATNQDALFYFYRTHSMLDTALNTNDTIHPQCWGGNIQDNLYCTLFLTAPAQLIISTGGNLTTNTLTAGLNQPEIPFRPGPQSFTVQRNGLTIMSAQGPDIQTNIQVYDYFTASGYAYATNTLLPPPTHLKVNGASAN